MKRTLIAILLLSSLACEPNDVNTDLRKPQIEKALFELDAFYRSQEAAQMNDREREQEALRITREFGIEIIPMSSYQFNKYNGSNRNTREACSGTPISVELVDEGNGCFGIVRKYSDISASITTYCRTSAGKLYFDGSLCSTPY